jgi:hypothetical protein
LTIISSKMRGLLGLAAQQRASKASKARASKARRIVQRSSMQNRRFSEAE